ncbi:hypothetical protein [Kitasatospora sp. NPDC093806]|uniref:hypothetical protein n=1 Tax=Kitasatospora sp. NPDC093806 TaxID=3155075 RepID=UPI00341D7B6B
MSEDRRPTADGERDRTGSTDSGSGPGSGNGGGTGTGTGSGSGGESAMERLLREALAARAARITAQDLRPADPPKGPRSRRRPAYLVGLPLMGLAAATVIGVLTVPTDTLAHKDDGPPAATMSDGPGPTRGPDPVLPTGFPVPPPDETARPAGGPTESPSGGPSASAEPVGPLSGTTSGRTGTGQAGATTPAPGGAPAGTPFVPPAEAPSGPATPGSGRPVNGIALSFDGLAGTQAIVGAGPVGFSVTWRNTTQQPYDAVAPVVAVRTLTDPVRGGRSVRGRLQREDEGGVWTDIPLTEGSGAYRTAADAAAFPLAAGAARTVRFRLDPAIDSGEGTLLIEALALLSATPERTQDASVLAPLLLTSAPADSRKAPELRISSGPSTGWIDYWRPSTFTMTVRNPGAAPLASVVPTVVLTGADAVKVRVRTRYGTDPGSLRTLPVSSDGKGQLVVDTSLLERLLKPGATTAFDFSFDVTDEWQPASADFGVIVGARGDGRDAVPVVIQPKFTPMVLPTPTPTGP